MANSVFSGLVTAWRFAACPTSRSSPSEKATIDGVVRAPSAFSMILADAPSMTATHELVVPRSIPITLLMDLPLAAADGEGTSGTCDRRQRGDEWSQRGNGRRHGPSKWLCRRTAADSRP